jgi:C4-dicarboxylate-specific signal transduction histidine kinase
MVSYSAGNMATGCPVTIEKITDLSLPEISVIPRDLSKALINLISNAHWEVNRKWMMNPDRFLPRIVIRTSKLNNTVLIEIMDNGDGINEEYTDKIFEPFFTTKPAGQGVGLGLSISNDIIRAHGGSITFSRSPEGANTESMTSFKITLPV